ncbi:urea ABC transporter permease subunit UrtB [Rubellimicrobium roseum]|uniref:Urea ABC transporter permease subunit UrtB n=1 Tax=Rubellimicrobium roseum TaxID=687525 RepID=A0A5C4NE51_9RHOB|nr:urea ABC transporter permease subunit UrtB [Rubellimicrobium roseum]TNC72180.1 urea ABC transporter permease subunit UrtB [Rubellimicrobium roseum]
MRILLALLVALWAPAAGAQTLQDLLQQEPEAISDPSRRTVGEVLDRLVDSGLPEVPVFLERWQGKEVWQRKSDGLFFYAEEDGDGHVLYDISTGEEAGRTGPRELSELKPNAGVRGVIGSALIEFQLSDPDPARRQAALDAIAKDPAPEQAAPLRASLEGEEDPDLMARKERLLALLSARFDEDPAARVAAIEALGADISVEARAVLNQILASRPAVAATLPEDANVARLLVPGSADLPREAAYVMLVEAGLAPPRVTETEIRDALVASIADGMVGETPVATLGTDAARHAAYDAIAPARGLPPRVTEAEVDAAISTHVFWQGYAEPDATVTAAAQRALGTAETRVALWQGADLLLDAVSLASIYFLAAIGLAITFGVMGVINMAHGEFIMMGAYTGYVVQTLVPDYTLSLLLALPLAFAVTFAAGVAMERLVIHHLAHRPLETLLATFGISIALQQVAKNVFGTQARPLTSPAWLDGAWVINDVAGIAYIRIAIFVLALLFLGLLLFILKRTRLGLEVRAVTQNPGMAASLGINPDRIGMLTFGLGSGIAGIAGVAIGLYAKVTSEMGADYIVQSFMTVVVGGVGNVWGTLAGAGLIGGFQKGVEWLNPSNTLAAQTFMILFIIAFIQVRPRGIVAMKGRAAGA